MTGLDEVNIAMALVTVFLLLFWYAQMAMKRRFRMRGDENKHDKGKPMWDLLPYGAVAQVVDVLTFGATKYGPWKWPMVEDARNRYFAAAMRHLTAWKEGEERDNESGLRHLAHAACCVLFLLWFDTNKSKEGKA